MTFLSASPAAPRRRTRPAPRAAARRRSWLSLAVPVVLSLSLASYLFLFRLPPSDEHAAARFSQSETTLAMAKRVDLTVIGGGLAGLSACIEAATLDPSLRVLLVEKEPKIGGNSAKASSGINAAVSRADEPVFEQDTLKSGGGLSNEVLVDYFVKQSPSGISFLEGLGADLSVLAQLGGHSAKRTHRNKVGPNVGFHLISTLQKAVDQMPNIEVRTATLADKFLLRDDGAAIRGLELKPADGESFTVESSAVILATGGFSASKEMLRRFAPGLDKFPTTNGAWALGEGILLAEAVGAGLTHMDKVQLHPTGFINPKDREAGHRFLAPEAIRGSGAVLLNHEGKRFVNELTTRDKASQAILAQPGQTAYMFLFEEGSKAMASSLGFYKHIGIVRAVNSVKEAAEAYALDPATVLGELNAYASAASGATKDPFGKEVFPFPLAPIASVDAPAEIHVMEIAPTLHYCMGASCLPRHERPGIGH